MAFLRDQNLEVECYWEHEIEQMLEEDQAMKEFFENEAHMDSGPIRLADAFFGLINQNRGLRIIT
jgi:hypothetical protein